MVVAVILLIAVLLTRDMRNGAIRTFFGGSVQPSELAKLVMILYLSVWLYSKQEYMHDIHLGLVPLGVILGGIAGLIYLEPDLSATITIFLLGGLLFFLAGGELRQIILFCLVALVAGWVVVQISSTGRARMASYLAGLKDPLKSSSHVLWSLEAVYRGKWFGVGIGNATTKLIGLPFSATDSIFAVIVEELGLFGALCPDRPVWHPALARPGDRLQGSRLAGFGHGSRINLLDHYRSTHQYDHDHRSDSGGRQCPAICQCRRLEPDFNPGSHRYPFRYFAPVRAKSAG